MRPYKTWFVSTVFCYLACWDIFPQFWPNLKEDTLSFDHSGASAIHVIKDVEQLPLSDSFMSIVKALSLYGMKPLPSLLSILMHLPRALKDVLIFLASWALTLSTLDFKILSEPARSTNINLLETCLLPFLIVYLSVTRQWDLLDRSLIAWLLAVLVASTNLMISITSSCEVTG